VGLRCRPTKLIYPDHRLPPWLTEDAPRDRSNRLLCVIVGKLESYRYGINTLSVNWFEYQPPCPRQDLHTEPFLVWFEMPLAHGDGNYLPILRNCKIQTSPAAGLKFRGRRNEIRATLRRNQHRRRWSARFHTGVAVNVIVHDYAGEQETERDGLTMAHNDEVERRGVAPTCNEADLSQSSTPSLVHRRCDPAIARTDC
jgi:hypothetical protein